MNTKNPNIETRIANRAKSIFAAFGQTVNDFYLEAGIYFVGGFNAALVAWDIYTTLIATGQPLAYAVILAIIAFIAVEGLAVYLVGAAAKTNNGLLWFFSVIFAVFFTYAHYQEMSGHGVIAQYITLAIPPFVVIGYWARTVKIDIETGQAQRAYQRESEVARQRKLEDTKRNYQIEQARLDADHRRNLAAKDAELKHAEKLARIEAKKVSESVPKSVPAMSQKVSSDKSLETLKAEIIAELGTDKPNMSQLARRLDIGRGTLYRHLGTLSETGEVIKNGNGYEVAK